jgi:replicative DNA helicase
MALEFDLIHSIITNKHLAPAVKKISPDYLLVPEAREIYKFIVEHFKKYKECPTPEHIKDKFPNYEHKIDTTDVNYFVDRIIERKLESNLSEVIVRASSKLQEDGAFKALSLLKSEVFTMNTGLANDEDADITKNIEDRKDRYATKAAVMGLIGIPCGLPTIDNLTSGFNAKELVTICGLTAVGKSFLAIHFAVNAWREGYKTLFITLEMSQEQIEERFDCLAAGLNHFQLRRGRLSTDDLNKYYRYLDEIKGKSAFIVSSPKDCTQSVIASKIQEHNPDIVFIDYIDLIRDEKGGQEFYKTANIIGDLKGFARDFNKPIVIIAQISRQGFEREVEDLPALENIASSHRIPRDSDIVLAVHQTNKQREDKTMMVGMIKNRDGKLIRKLDLVWDLDKGQIIEKEEMEKGKIGTGEGGKTDDFSTEEMFGGK